LRFGISEEKFKAVWDFERSDLYTSGEKAALTMTIAAVQTPNAVSDEHFVQMRKYWREEQIVEIVAIISVFGFLNRWNDTMGTPLEDEPLETGERFLSDSGWTPGKHAR
jgi:alkylhydroperoxidase family enzyme